MTQTNDGPGTADGHRRASSYWSVTHFSSALEQLTMARDPDLQRFAGARIRRHVVGQFHTVLQWRSVCIGIPWQHLNKVLHFVCELRESRGGGEAAQMTPKRFQQRAPIFIPWCAGTSRHERLVRKHVPDSDPGSIPAPAGDTNHRRPNNDSPASQEKCSAGACPQLGAGCVAQTTPDPFFIPWCAGPCRHQRFL